MPDRSPEQIRRETTQDAIDSLAADIALLDSTRRMFAFRGVPKRVATDTGNLQREWEAHLAEMKRRLADLP